MSWAAVAKSATAPPAPTEAPPPRVDERIAIVDANAIISGLRLEQLADRFCTIPEVLAEIRDKQSRAFLSTLPFSLDVREPSDESVKAVQRFARETGDINSLSAVDVKLLALAHSLELAAHGAAHLREHPVQVRTQQKHKSRPRVLPGWGNVTNPEDWRVVDEAPEELLTNAEGGQSRIIAAVQSLTLGDEGQAHAGAAPTDATAAAAAISLPLPGAPPSAAASETTATTTAAGSDAAPAPTSLPPPGPRPASEQGRLQEQPGGSAQVGEPQQQQPGQQQGGGQGAAEGPSASSALPDSDDDDSDDGSDNGGGWETAHKSRSVARRKQRKARRHQAWLEQQQQRLQEQQPGAAAGPSTPTAVAVAGAAAAATGSAAQAAAKVETEQPPEQPAAAADGTPGAHKECTEGQGHEGEEEEEDGEGEEEVEGEGEEIEGLELVTDEGYDEDGEGEGEGEEEAGAVGDGDGAASEAGTAVTGVTDATATAASVAAPTSVITDSELLPNTTSNVFSVTADFAMQNVLLQMGLRLVARDGKQINRVSRWALRCSACFFVTKEAGRVFCPRCGNLTLDKVEVTVGPGGAEFFGVRKKFILRGTKFSLPKPKGGRGARSNPVLREDVMLARMAGGRIRPGAAKPVPAGELDPFAPEYGSETWHQVTGGGRGSGGRGGALRGKGGVLLTGWKNNPNEVKPQRKSRRK